MTVCMFVWFVAIKKRSVLELALAAAVGQVGIPGSIVPAARVLCQLNINTK